MKKSLDILLWIIGGLWAVFSFFASNSPNEVSSRANGWLASPFFNAVPNKLTAFAASPWVLALSFFAVGIFAGWRLSKWQDGRSYLKWWKVLGLEMSELSYRIDQASWSDVNRLNAEIDVVRVKAKERNFSFPAVEAGFTTVQSLLPYLTRVSAFLESGKVEHARNVAKALAEKPTVIQ